VNQSLGKYLRQEKKGDEAYFPEKKEKKMGNIGEGEKITQAIGLCTHRVGASPG